jgi:hypothetical protein
MVQLTPKPSYSITVQVAFSLYRYKSEITNVRFEYLADDAGLRIITMGTIVT